jgi:uncharacterized membrane protein YidH (DUF202 family)
VAANGAVGGESGSSGVGSALGLVLIALGAVVSAIGAYRFLRTEREIDTQSYRPSVLTHLLLTVAIVLASVTLFAYLWLTPR